MKIRTMLITFMLIFSLFSMILFTVIVSVSFNTSVENQYKDMMMEMTVKQSRSLELFFNYYMQRVIRIAENPVIEDYITYIEENPQTNTILDPDFDEFEVITLADNGYSEAQDILNTLMYEGSGITGITIFNLQSEIVLSAGTDQSDFLLSMKREQLGRDRFATVLAANATATDPKFELLQYTQISDQHFVMCTYSSSDLEMLFNRSKLPTSGKLILICPLRNLIDQTLRGNLDETSSLGLSEYSKIRNVISDEKYLSGDDYFTFDVSRILYHALFTQVGDTGWLLGVVAKDSDIHVHSKSSVSSLRNITILIGLLMAALAILFAVWFTHPLSVIREALTKVKRSEHDIRINIKSNNEYKNIADEFNILFDNVVVGEGRYKTVVEMSNNIIFEWNFKTDNVTFSNNFGKKFSYRAPSDSYSDSFLVKCKVHPEDIEKYKLTLEKLSKGEDILHDEFRWKNIFGDYIWVLMRACRIHGTNGEIAKVVGVIIDIDRAKKSEKILSARASYDALTGLYNRETLENLINNEIELISARKNEFAVLFIDVDDFKFFNDNYSHATGDQVLRFTALTINDIVGKYGLAGRFGGDEFVICVRNSEINDPEKSAIEILNRLKDGFICDVGDKLSVNVSIGIAIIRDTTKRVDEIIGMADDAMYKIKKSGKSNYGFIN